MEEFLVILSLLGMAVSCLLMKVSYYILVTSSDQTVPKEGSQCPSF